MLFVTTFIVLVQVIQNAPSKEQRRILIEGWRNMVHEISTKLSSQDNISAVHEISHHQGFFGLQGHLNQEVVREILSETTWHATRQGLHPVLSRLLGEIDRIEKQWGLP